MPSPGFEPSPYGTAVTVSNLIPDGWHWLWSRIRAQMPLKIRRLAELMHVKSVEAQSPPVGVVWWFAEDQLRCRSRHLTDVQSSEVRRQQPSCCFIERC
ncbi:hypothetical protein TNCV_2781141 [Trichonephila clavipes]|nr:hypothetical protein TNCV_2781141 [Trichonephila clavipes]